MQKLAKEQGCTIFLVTHNSRILDIADRVVNMEDGSLRHVSDSVIPIHESFDTNDIFLILPLTSLWFLICINFRVKWYNIPLEVFVCNLTRLRCSFRLITFSIRQILP